MGISITEFADQKIDEAMQKAKMQKGFLKVGVKGGGCSGLSYVFEFVKTPDKEDRIFTFSKISVCVDKKSYLFLNGMTIDYEETMFKSGIVITNPNAKRQCGCGESFSF